MVQRKTQTSRKTLNSENIRQIREQKGWSIDHLAFHSGLNARKISLLERGLVRKVKAQDLEQLAEALGTPMDKAYQAERHTPVRKESLMEGPSQAA